MTIKELKDNWENVRSDIMTKHPYIICVLLNRDIEVKDTTITMRFEPGEKATENIAKKYAGVICEGISAHIGNGFCLKIGTDGDE